MPPSRDAIPRGLAAAKTISPRAILFLLFAAFVTAGCGYHVAGTTAHLPSSWDSIAIPAFTNDTTTYRVEQLLTQAVIREFTARTKYRITQDPASASAVLHGEVVSMETTPILFNATTGEVTAMLVTIHVKASLVDTQTQKPVYQNSDMVFRDEYQISPDVKSFFEEQDPALERMSRNFASHFVADVLEGF